MDFVRPADNGLEYDVHVRQDSNAPKHRLWFHFQMQGGYAGAHTVHDQRLSCCLKGCWYRGPEKVASDTDMCWGGRGREDWRLIAKRK